MTCVFSDGGFTIRGPLGSYFIPWGPGQSMSRQGQIVMLTVPGRSYSDCRPVARLRRGLRQLHRPWVQIGTTDGFVELMASHVPEYDETEMQWRLPEWAVDEEH